MSYSGKECLVTVIVPVWNMEDRIENCISSIQHQTWRNLQIIVINDGSTDLTQQIVEKIAQVDERVQLINQSNAGVSEARNRGLDLAAGKWIMFVDSDDYIEPNCIECLMGHVYGNTDIVVSAYKVRVGNEVLSNKPCHTAATVMNFEGKEEIAKLLLLNGWIERIALWSVWGGIIKREVIYKNGLHFDRSISISEDELFSLDCYAAAQKITIINEPLYIVWKKEKSLSSKGCSMERALSAKKKLLKKKMMLYSCWGLYDENMEVNQMVYDSTKFLIVNLIARQQLTFKYASTALHEWMNDGWIHKAVLDYDPPRFRDRIIRRLILLKCAFAMALLIIFINKMNQIIPNG